jgi:hypothetical protein
MNFEVNEVQALCDLTLLQESHPPWACGRVLDIWFS